MCTADATHPYGDAFGPASAPEALAMAGAAMDYLNSPAGADLSSFDGDTSAIDKFRSRDLFVELFVLMPAPDLSLRS